jgi:hypothetical protein
VAEEAAQVAAKLIDAGADPEAARAAVNEALRRWRLL